VRPPHILLAEIAAAADALIQIAKTGLEPLPILKTDIKSAVGADAEAIKAITPASRNDWVTDHKGVPQRPGCAACARLCSLKSTPPARLENVMTIEEQGFLSPDISVWTGKHRAENSQWFELAENLNRIACGLLPHLSVPPDDNSKFLAALLFMRGLSNYQGAILLAERGMSAEARTLTRSCFETVFCLGALCKDPGFADRFVQDDADRRKKIARALLNAPNESSGLTQDEKQKLVKLLSDQEASAIESAPLVIAQAAVRADMAGEYDVFYRGLSNDAAHPSVNALNRHVQADENGEVKGLQWGPDVNDVSDTLLVACTACIYLANLTRSQFAPETAQDALEHCWATYKSLVRDNKERFDAELQRRNSA